MDFGSDFSDARHVLSEARRREGRLALELGESDPINPLFEQADCLGNGFWHHPLLAAPGSFTRQHRSVAMSGEVRDGRGHHPSATFTVR